MNDMNILTVNGEQYNVADKTAREKIANDVANVIKETIAGTTVSTDMVSPIEHNVVCKVSGVPNPETVTVSRYGKNILVKNTNTSGNVNNISWNLNDDGTVTVNSSGATGNVNIVASEEFNIPAGDYVLTGCPSDNVQKYSYLQGFGTKYFNSGAGILEAGKGKEVNFPTADVIKSIRISIRTGFTGTATFSPMLRLKGTSSEFEKPIIPETFTPSPSGEVTGMKSISPSMTILTDNPGANLEVTYNVDTKKYVEDNQTGFDIVESLPTANEENYKKAKLYLNGDALSYQIKLQAKPELTRLNDNLVQYYPYCSAASFDKYVYLFGGQNRSSGKLVNIIIKYDTETEESKILPEVLPKPLIDSAAITMDNYIYIIGGSGSSSIYKFNCKTEKLEEENAVLPAPNQSTGLAKYGKFIFIFGGNKTTNIYQFDTGDHKVVGLGTKLPQGCYKSVVGVYGQYAYIIPTIPNVFDCVQVWKFNLSSYSISTMSLTSGFGNVAEANGAVMGNVIYTAGHKDNTVKQYKIDSDSVIQLDGVLSDGISSCAVVNANGKIYILGGMAYSNGLAVLATYKISTDEKYGYATLATTAQTTELTNAVLSQGGNV